MPSVHETIEELKQLNPDDEVLEVKVKKAEPKPEPKSDSPHFPGGLLLTQNTYVIDHNGVGWWIDFENRKVTKA